MFTGNNGENLALHIHWSGLPGDRALQVDITQKMALKWQVISRVLPRKWF